MAGSKVLLSYINSYLDDTQQDRLTALNRDTPEEYDMRELQKYRLLDRQPERLVTDDGPRRNVESIQRPLEMREYGNRSKLAPYLSEVCLQDRAKDPRGTETHPQMSKIPLYTLQKGQWIENNLYKDQGLEQVTEQIEHLKVVDNRQQTDKRMKEYLKIFSDERVGAHNQRQFNPNDVKGATRLALEQQDEEDSKNTPVEIGAPNRPVKRQDYTRVEDEDGLQMVSRTEPSHLEQVGDRSQLIYSNPVFDPVERAQERGELFTNNRRDPSEGLNLIDRSHDHRKIVKNSGFANALIDEQGLDLARQDHTLIRSGKPSLEHMANGDTRNSDQDERRFEEKKALIKRYKDLQNIKRDQDGSQLDQVANNRALQALAAVKRGLEKRTHVNDREHVKQDMSFIERIQKIVGIAPGAKRSKYKDDHRRLGSNDNQLNYVEHLQSSQRTRKGALHSKNLVINPIAHADLQGEVDSVNLQYDALSEDGKSTVYRLSAVFIPPKASPAIKLQIAEELIEMVTRNRIPKAQIQTIYNPHASDQDIEQLAIVLTQTLLPRLKQKLPSQEAQSVIQQISSDHVKAFQELAGVTHGASAFAYFGKEALESKKHNTYNPQEDAQRGDHVYNPHITNMHVASDTAATSRALGGSSQIEYAVDENVLNTEKNSLRSGGDKKGERRFVEYDSITDDAEKELVSIR